MTDDLSPIGKLDLLELLKKHGLVTLDASVDFLDTPDGAPLVRFAEAVRQYRSALLPDEVERLFNIPMTAAAWDLYAGHAGAEDAAQMLGNTLRDKLDDARATGRCNLETAGQIRDSMYHEMNKCLRFGARDTEPEIILVTAIERALGLHDGALER